MAHECFTIAVASNDENVLRRNLLTSPELSGEHGHQLLVKCGFTSAAHAYNQALDEAQHDVVVFLHQDLYLPEPWFAELRRALAYVDALDTDWGVLGCFGSRRGAHGGLGQVYSRGVGRHGNALARPVPVETLDEIVLVIRKSSGLRFDKDLPSFHLYGTDLCLTARTRGLVNYAFQGFCIHNTNQLLMLPRDFYDCCAYVRHKWRHHLPIYTACMKLSRMNLALHHRRFVDALHRVIGPPRQAALRADDPRVLCSD